MSYNIIAFFQIIVIISDVKTKYLQRSASVKEKLKYKIKYNTSFYFEILYLYMSITHIIMDINNYYFRLSTDILWLFTYTDTNNNLC